MSEVCTIKITSGPYPAAVVPVPASGLNPTNNQVGTVVSSSAEGFPPYPLAHFDLHEVLSDGSVGLQQVSYPGAPEGTADYVAVTKTGLYLIQWRYRVTAKRTTDDGVHAAEGLLGLIGMSHIHNNLNFDADPAQQMVVAVATEDDEGLAVGGASALLWLQGGEVIPEGFSFSIQQGASDLVDTTVSVQYSVTLLQPGGTPIPGIGG